MADTASTDLPDLADLAEIGNTTAMEALALINSLRADAARLTQSGVHYCTVHAGIRNEDSARECDMAPIPMSRLHGDSPRLCEFTDLLFRSPAVAAVASDAEECIHGLGPVAGCVLCNGRAEREAATDAGQPRTFPAKYDGQCSECNLPITVGEMVAWLPDHPVTHADCWPTDTPTGSLL